MFQKKLPLFYSIPAIVISVLVATAFVFAEATLTPPQGNTPAPLHVGATGQAKDGGLILNTGGAVNGLIVAEGKVGIGTTNPDVSPTVKLDVNGGLKFIPQGQRWSEAISTYSCLTNEYVCGITCVVGVIGACENLKVKCCQFN